MKTVKLAEKEIRAIGVLLWSNPCSSGCAYEEVQDKNIECDKCELTEALESLTVKLGFRE